MFCTLLIDSQNPTGLVGSCTLTPIAKVAAITSLSTKQDSDMVVLNTSHTKTQSDIALVDAAIDSDMVLVIADHDKTQSDIALIDAAIDSDMVLVDADHNKTQSDIALLSTKQDSDMVVVATAHTKTQSDIVIVASDTLAIESKTGGLTFTKAGEVDANTKSINDAEVVGDGNATGWDGV